MNSKIVRFPAINAQLHKTTLTLISLIQFYRTVSGTNEKLMCAMKSSKLLMLEGGGLSSEMDKLQFCTEAVEAIATVVVENKSQPQSKRHTSTLLGRDEIDFINAIMLGDEEDIR